MGLAEPPPWRSDAAAWQRYAADMFARAFGPRRLIQIVVRDPHDRGARLVMYVRTRVPIEGPLRDQPEPDDLTPLERAIFRVATSKPQCAKCLAKLLGRKANSYFQAGLRALSRHDPPLLVRTPDGYRRYPPKGEPRS